MTDVAPAESLSVRGGPVISARMAAILPPFLALLYPLAVWGLFASASLMREAEGTTKIAALYGATASLLCAAIPSLVSFAMLVGHNGREGYSGTRWITLLAFAAPALFTVERVIAAGFRWTFDDRLVWIVVWVALTAIAAAGRERKARLQPAWTGRLRFAHGVSAAVILALFLIAHLGNHFIGLLGTDLHIQVMEMLRVWYRSGIVEPVIVALFLFQVASGVWLASIRQYAPNDPFRMLQVATGVGVAAFLSAHMLVIFIVARWGVGIDTNWVFATGFKVGLLGNLSNARQVPYYLFATFVTIAHLACGLRVVLLAHSWRIAITNRIAVGIIVSGGVFAIATVAGMLGLRLG
ncbi:hypothetical protein [Bradyrhizobium liaoningense]|uniref:hypothetical protein n=1 Tax=Bradyrhizobium liaoningense TaxID=43992 RepID=UPI001BA49FCD|nr:hypothetical protein [Bradyrhizobium liaoningense]MBR0717960.1 hypothetical protein [Bradyrhizobium liaoningense]